VVHARHQEQAREGGSIAAVGGSQFLEIADRVLGREHRVAVAVVDDQLAATRLEGGQVGGSGIENLAEFDRRCRVGVEVVGKGVDAGIEELSSARSACEKALVMSGSNGPTAEAGSVAAKAWSPRAARLRHWSG
jgi:hypothetical protein